MPKLVKDLLRELILTPLTLFFVLLFHNLAESFLWDIAFADNMEMLGLSFRFLEVCYTLALFVTAFAVFAVMYHYDPAKKASYTVQAGKPGGKRSLRYCFADRFLWVRFGAVAVGLSILVWNNDLPCLARAVFGTEAIPTPWQKILVIFGMISVVFGTYLLACLYTLSRWNLPPAKEEKGSRRKLPPEWEFLLPYFRWAARMFFLLLLYLLISLALRFAIFIVLIQMLWKPILCIAGGIALLRCGFLWMRAWRKQHRFYKKLCRLCEQENIPLQMHKSPYLSVFGVQKGYHFTVSRGGKDYCCKILSATLRSAPLTFRSDGRAIRTRTFRLRRLRVDLFTVVSELSFSFEAEGNKVILLIPSPAEFFIRDSNGRAVLADNGDRAGDYQIFAGSGFLGALERDSFHRRGN